MASEADFLLFWSDPAVLEGSRESGDPLGLRAWANRIAQRLVPGLRNGTDRVQGFGLVCAALVLSERSAFSDLGPDETFLRLERAWVLAQAAARQSGEEVPVWPGDRRAQRFLTDRAVDLGEPLLSRQLQMGTWGMYRRAAGALGLIQPAGLGLVRAPREAELTESGRVLGREWIDFNVPADARAALSQRMKAASVPTDKVIDLFFPDLPPYAPVADPLTAALKLPTSGYSELRALRAVWAAAGDLDIRSLKRHEDLLTADQAQLLPQAAAVQALCRRVELPFRRYLRRGSAAAPPGPRLHTLRAWSAVPREENDVRLLEAALRRAPRSWLGVRRRAIELAHARGHELSDPGSAPSGYDRAPIPALSLKAAEALFSQGFLEPSPQVQRSSAPSSREVTR